ncbi:MAG TPA: hypothetical protein DCL31_12125, partial [Clostridium sp.]|nr:hypothetical protein [Clostridium sp.]
DNDNDNENDIDISNDFTVTNDNNSNITFNPVFAPKIIIKMNGKDIEAEWSKDEFDKEYDEYNHFKKRKKE